MKYTRMFIASLALLAALAASAYSATDTSRSGGASPKPGLRTKGAAAMPGSPSNAQIADSTGALPEQTQAERISQADAAVQQWLTAISTTMDGISIRVDEMRRQNEQPAKWEIERVDQDMSMIAQELGSASPTQMSPLSQLQRGDLQDRLFQMQLSMEIAKRRWGGTWEVFGMDFFSSAPAVPAIDHRTAPASYRLRTGDKLRVSVTSSLGQETIYTPTVSTTGTIYVPGAGTIPAEGRTCGQVSNTVNAKISSRFRQLRASVTIESLSTIQVQVSGAAVRPGAYMLAGTATVLNALYQAGGPNKSGSFRKISLVRDGQPKRTVDLYDFLMSGSKSQDSQLRDGDLIFIPPVGQTIVVDGDVVRPSRYEPSFPVTLGEALKMAGGVKASGYLHSVQVERVENNESRVLLQEQVSSSTGQSSFALKPGDQVTVLAVRSDKTNQVSIQGPVLAPGVFGFRKGMRVSELIKMAQGLDENREIYGGRADVLRIDALKGYEIVSFSLDRALHGDASQDVEMRKLDQVFIYEPDQVVFRPRLVTVAGAVVSPGTYRRAEGMRVSDAVAAAGGVLPNAYLKRAELIRHDSNGESELVNIELEDALSGDTTANVTLSDRDEIRIRNISDVVWFDHRVRIEGAVQRPGVYTWSRNMRVSDLVFEAGGLLPERAGIAEVGRVSAEGQSRVLTVDLAKLVAGGEQDIVLEDRDTLTIPAVNPALRSAEIVYITGEVANPGPYTLNGRDENLVDLLKRAGGLTKYADSGGTLFLRQKDYFENSQQEKDADLVMRKTKAFSDKEFVAHLAKMGVAGADIIKAIEEKPETLAAPTEVVAEERLSKDVAAEGSLEGGQSQTVSPWQQVSGVRAGAGGGSNAGPGGSPYAGQPTVAAPNQATPGANRDGSRNALLPPSGQLSPPERTSAMGPKVGEATGQRILGFQGRQDIAQLMNSVRISVSLDRAQGDPKSPDNLTLRQGDHVFIPRVSEVVTVVGAVLHPHVLAASPGKNVAYYIQRSGGFARDAAKGCTVVVRTNGDAFPGDQAGNVEPGDMIVVPTTGLIDVTRGIDKVGSVTKVLADLLSSVFIITRF